MNTKAYMFQWKRNHTNVYCVHIWNRNFDKSKLNQTAEKSQEAIKHWKIVWWTHTRRLKRSYEWNHPVLSNLELLLIIRHLCTRVCMHRNSQFRTVIWAQSMDTMRFSRLMNLCPISSFEWQHTCVYAYSNSTFVRMFVWVCTFLWVCMCFERTFTTFLTAKMLHSVVVKWMEKKMEEKEEENLLKQRKKRRLRGLEFSQSTILANLLTKLVQMIFRFISFYVSWMSKLQLKLCAHGINSEMIK